MFRLTCPTRWRWIVSSCAISAATLGFVDHVRAELSKETVVGIVVVSIRANYAPIHRYRAKTKEVLLDPTVTEKTTTVTKTGDVTVEATQAPRSESVCDLAVSGGNCYFNISGDDNQLLVIRDGRAVQRSGSRSGSLVLTQGRYIPENFEWFSNYDLREQGLFERDERLGPLLTDSYIDSATLETMPDGNVVAKIKIIRPEGNWITIEADGARNFLPSQICFGVPAEIGEKVTLEYDRVAGFKDKWFLKRCVKYLSGSKDIREIDSPDWNTGCQTLELLVTELQVNADIPVSLFQWPKAKAGMTISDADEKRAYIFEEPRD